MNILAFDLANFSSSIALMKKGTIVMSSHSEVFRGQDITLLPTLKKILEDNNLSFQDLDCIVTTTGPGSFTGIRVGLATAQGLSFAATIPALGINSFEWVIKSYLNKTSSGLGSILVLLESLRKELYGQLFNHMGEPIAPPFSLSPEEIMKNELYKNALCIGNGAKYLKDYDITIEDFMPQASHLAEIALKIPQDKQKDYPCLPVYIRDADTSKPKTK